MSGSRNLWTSSTCRWYDYIRCSLNTRWVFGAGKFFFFFFFFGDKVNVVSNCIESMCHKPSNKKKLKKLKTKKNQKTR